MDAGLVRQAGNRNLHVRGFRYLDGSSEHTTIGFTAVAVGLGHGHGAKRTTHAIFHAKLPRITDNATHSEGVLINRILVADLRGAREIDREVFVLTINGIELDGEIELDRSYGTEFNITFKELKYKKRL